MWDNKKTKATPKDGPCMSEFEGKAVVPGYREPGWCGGPVSQLSVNSCRSLKEKSGQQGVR